jgi:hypothetical protein
MYKTGKLNIEKNLKFDSGFKDKLGVSDMVNVNIEFGDIILSEKDQSVKVFIRFFGDNFDNTRIMEFKKEDISTAELNVVKNFRTKIIEYVLAQTEFANAEKL